MRVLIATAAACGGSANTALFVPLLAAGGRRVVLSIQPGDTLWFLADGDTVEGWRPNPIRGVHQISGTCGQLAADAGRTVFDPERLLSVDLRDTVGDVKSSLVRLTRPIRYSIYRAGDGLWYLGLQTWSPASMQFNTVQPLSGPYEPPGPSATRIEYFDTSGNVLAPGTPNTRDIARIEWMLRSRSPAGALTPGDSTRIVVAMRNRR
jgi:hypothetical protein